jgi:hypothetical protein
VEAVNEWNDLGQLMYDLEIVGNSKGTLKMSEPYPKTTYGIGFIYKYTNLENVTPQVMTTGNGAVDFCPEILKY